MLGLLLPLVSCVVVVDFHGEAEYNVSHLASLVGEGYELTHVMLFNTTDESLIEEQLDSLGLGELFGRNDLANTTTIDKRDSVSCDSGKLTIKQTTISSYKTTICSPLSALVAGAGATGAVIVKNLYCSETASGEETSNCSLGILFTATAITTITVTNVQGFCEKALTNTWAECSHGGTATLVGTKRTARVYMDEFESVRDCSNDGYSTKHCKTVAV